MLATIKKESLGIFLPESLLKFNQLNPTQKFFIAKINSLDNENHCYASDDFFSEFFGLCEKQCNRIIQQLADKKLISIDTTTIPDFKGGFISKRIISVLPDIKKQYFPPRKNSGVYAGIWIPLKIWIDKTFNVIEKLLYCLIKSFNNALGCLYSNKEYAEILGISRVRVCQIIKSLWKKRVIKILKRDNGRDNRQAKSIYLNNNCATLTSKNLESTSKNLETTSKNVSGDGLISGGHSNTPINNTQNSNTQDISKADKSVKKRLTPRTESTQEWVKIHSNQMKKAGKTLSKQPIHSLINQYITENSKDRRRFYSLFWVVANNDVIYQSLLCSLIDSSKNRHNDQSMLTANDAIDYCFHSLKSIYRDEPIAQYMN